MTGCLIFADSPMIVSEILSNGDLKTFLQVNLVYTIKVLSIVSLGNNNDAFIL